MILKNDQVQFVVSFKKNEKMVSESFKTFAAAAGCASALDGMVRMIDIKASNLDQTSGWSATLYVFSKDNTRRVANQFAVDQTAQYTKNQMKSQ